MLQRLPPHVPTLDCLVRHCTHTALHYAYLTNYCRTRYLRRRALPTTATYAPGQRRSCSAACAPPSHSLSAARSLPTSSERRLAYLRTTIEYCDVSKRARVAPGEAPGEGWSATWRGYCRELRNANALNTPPLGTVTERTAAALLQIGTNIRVTAARFRSPHIPDHVDGKRFVKDIDTRVY